MAKSIFTIWQPEGELETVVNMKTVTAAPFPDDDEHLMQITQYGVCKLNKIAKCPVLKSTGAGTAFLIHDQNTISTVLHNVQTWMHWAKKLNPSLNLRSFSPPVFMTDLNNDVVFNPLDENQRMRLKTFNPSSGLFARPYADFKTQEEREYISASELVEFSISPALEGRPFQTGSHPVEGQRLFAVGFPMETTVFGEGDSNGEDLYASILTADLRVPSDWPGFEMHGPLVEGNSGSPILNDGNEVVGIAIAGGCSLSDHTCEFKNGLPVISAAALSIDLATNQKAWKRISRQPGTSLP